MKQAFIDGSQNTKQSELLVLIRRFQLKLPVIQIDVVKTTRNDVAKVYYDVILTEAYYDVIMT